MVSISKIYSTIFSSQIGGSTRFLPHLVGNVYFGLLTRDSKDCSESFTNRFSVLLRTAKLSEPKKAYKNKALLFIGQI